MTTAPSASAAIPNDREQFRPVLRSANLGNFGGGHFRRAIDATSARGNPAAYLLLTFLCLIAFGIGLVDLPPTDRDESRFMQATKQMVETGDYVHIRVQDVPRLKKPIGIHWLQAAAVTAFGQPFNTAWPYRIPSALGAWGAVLLVCAIGRRIFSPGTGLIAGAITATFPLTIVEAHLAKTDAVLFGFVTLTMAALAWLYIQPVTEAELLRGNIRTKRWPAAVFWLAAGAAFLVKGPVVILIAGATIGTLCIVDRSAALIRALHPVWGLPLAAAVAAPWFIALGIGGESNFIATAVKQDLLPKLIGGQEFHGSPPGAHIIAALVTTWPWSLLLPVALIAAWPHREDPAIRFCLAWLVPAWLAFEAIPTKLPNYVLPLLPAAALLLGAVVVDVPGFTPLLRRRGDLAWRCMWALMTVGFGAAIVWIAIRFGADGGVTANPWAAVIAGAMVIIAVLAVVVAGRVRTGTIIVAATLTALCFGILLVSRIAPSLDRLWISTRLVAALARHPSPEPIMLAGYHEPSAVFLLGTTTRLVHPMTAAAELLTHPGAIAAIDDSMLPDVTSVIKAAGYDIVPLETIAGQNYAAGKPVRLIVLTIAKP